MTEPAAIDGAYADFKLVKTRSVCQLVIEIPIERAEEAIRKFGIPQPGKEVPVAIALLNIEAAAQPSPDKSAAAKERYRQMPEWQKAQMRSAMLCRDRDFQVWLMGRSVMGQEWEAATLATAKALRDRLGVKSRAEIATDKTVYDAFIAVETAYKQATGQFAEQRS